jgi:hypothetical protein
MKKSYIFLLATVLSSTLANSQVNRVPLIETFTSSTCPPCNPANVALESLLGQAANNGKFVSLKYQVNWPGNGDPYYTAEANTRRTYYSVTGVPNGFVDAGFDDNPGNLTQGLLDGFYAVAPKAQLGAYYQVNETTKTVDVQIDFEALEALPPTFRMFVAIFEYETSNNVGGNGETQFEHVMKKMMSGATGDYLGAMTANELGHEEYSYTFNGNYRLPSSALDPINHASEHSVEEFSDLGVAIWLQNSGTKEVYQSAYAIKSALSIDETVGTLEGVIIYPNPSAGSSAIVFNSADAQDVTIEVINTLGQVVHASSMENCVAGRNVYDLSTDEFANGIYSVRITAANGMVSKKLSVQK